MYIIFDNLCILFSKENLWKQNFLVKVHAYFIFWNLLLNCFLFRFEIRGITNTQFIQIFSFTNTQIRNIWFFPHYSVIDIIVIDYTSIKLIFYFLYILLLSQWIILLTVSLKSSITPQPIFLLVFFVLIHYVPSQFSPSLSPIHLVFS